MLGVSLSMRGQLYEYTSVVHVGNDAVRLRRAELVPRLKIVKS